MHCFSHAEGGCGALSRSMSWRAPPRPARGLTYVRPGLNTQSSGSSLPDTPSAAGPVGMEAGAAGDAAAPATDEDGTVV